MITVGCCGYPVARKKYYSRFPAVEIQTTFYNPPDSKAAERWRTEAPKGFEFVVKAWQLITHSPQLFLTLLFLEPCPAGGHASCRICKIHVVKAQRPLRTLNDIRCVAIAGLADGAPLTCARLRL